MSGAGATRDFLGDGPPHPLPLPRRRLRLARLLRVRPHRRRPPPRGLARRLESASAWMLDKPDGKVVGFKVLRFSEFDAERCKGIWKGPRFHVPALGLRKASAGEICLAAKGAGPGRHREPAHVRLRHRPRGRGGDARLAARDRGRRPDGPLRPRLHAAGAGRPSRRLQAPSRLHRDRQAQPVGVELPRPRRRGAGRSRRGAAALRARARARGAPGASRPTPTSGSRSSVRNRVGRTTDAP